jgi:adenine C2-methylase RlmN of 23S rRNA A2503 and tRNA A37
MSWSFTDKPRRQKSAVQLQQEAAEILALGGGYQAYFTAERQPFRLLVSLTSADPEVRRTLMPIEQMYPTPALLDALRAYHAVTGARVTLAWPLLAGINTRAADAQQLAQLTRGLPIKLDLIDVNDPSGRFHPPSTEERHAFRDALRQYLAAPVARRYSGGQDIHAACGMLAGARAGEELATEDAAVTEKKPRTKLHRRISNKEGRSTAAADREPPPQAENRPPA